MLVCVKNRLK